MLYFFLLYSTKIKQLNIHLKVRILKLKGSVDKIMKKEIVNGLVLNDPDKLITKKGKEYIITPEGNEHLIEHTLREKYFDTIVTNLIKNERKFFNYISKYRNREIDKWADTVECLYQTPLFKDVDWKIVFDVSGVNEKEMERDINEIVKKLGHKKTNFIPFRTILFFMMRYYVMSKQPKKLEMIIRYYGYSIYFTLWFKSFKSRGFNPDINVLRYTVENLTNKFIVRQLGSIDEMLLYGINLATETYLHRIVRGSDYDVWSVIDQIQNRIGGYIKSLCSVYMDNYAKGNKIYLSDAIKKDGTVTEIIEMVSVSGEVMALARSYATKFFSTPPSKSIISKAAKFAGVSAIELGAAIHMLHQRNSSEEVSTFYASIFSLFFDSDEHPKESDLHSIKFLSIMEGIYKKGNSNNKNIIAVKTLMEKWLQEGSSVYRASNRPGTINNFKKSIYYYFIFTVIL